MSLDRRILRKQEQLRMRELFNEPSTPSFIRLPSKNEREQHPKGIFVCVHNRHYFLECPHCKRSESDAQRNERHALENVIKLKRSLGIA